MCDNEDSASETPAIPGPFRRQGLSNLQPFITVFMTTHRRILPCFPCPINAPPKTLLCSYVFCPYSRDTACHIPILTLTVNLVQLTASTRRAVSICGMKKHPHVLTCPHGSFSVSMPKQKRSPGRKSPEETPNECEVEEDRLTLLLQV